MASSSGNLSFPKSHKSSVELIIGCIEYPKKYGNAGSIASASVNLASSGKEIFKFLSDNSFAAGSLVEYSLIVTQDKSCVVTQYMDKHVSSGLTMRIMNN